ncbi:hypothetical protein TNCV_2858301 [Trichonephila clavipes]|nr:hypothetical protein TNCV_2858301 [Trichonephila clavipes]
MPLSRMENTTFAMPNIIDSHDMGLRTVLQSRRPKENAYSTPMTKEKISETTHKRAPRPSYYHERYQRYYRLLADTTNTSCSLRKAQGYSSWYLSTAQFYVRGCTFTQPEKFLHMELYQMSIQAMPRKKDEMVSELKTLPTHVLEMIATNIKSPLP